jgi:hypothetical protein
MKNFNIFVVENNSELSGLYELLKNYHSDLFENLNYLDFCKTIYYNFY